MVNFFLPRVVVFPVISTASRNHCIESGCLPLFFVSSSQKNIFNDFCACREENEIDLDSLRQAAKVVEEETFSNAFGHPLCLVIVGQDCSTAPARLIDHIAAVDRFDVLIPLLVCFGNAHFGLRSTCRECMSLSHPFPALCLSHYHVY